MRKIYLFVTAVIICMVVSSCSDETLNPIEPRMVDSEVGKSNVIRLSDIKNNPETELKDGMMAEIKYEGDDFNGENGLIVNLKLRVAMSGVYGLNIDNELMDVKISNENEEVNFSNGSLGKSVNLMVGEVYSISVYKNMKGKLKMGDVIYIRLKKNFETGNEMIDVSVNSCNECLFVNTVFSGTVTNQVYTNSEFAICDFNQANFGGCDFTGSLFKNTTMSNSIFTSSKFDNVDFNVCNLNNISFFECDFNYAGFNSSSVYATQFQIGQMENFMFNNVNVFSTGFIQCNMKNAKLTSVFMNFNTNNMNFNYTDLTNAQVAKFNLSYSNLMNNNFTGTDFTGSEFNGALITGSTFYNTNLNYANLCGVKGTPAVFKGVSQIGTKCPIGN
ncbi:MAG TPA: pentapeptide repeat-containing protein [Ignavibacteria bacterium]|nr:pentapeptide repeat-containing protein [Ignavibacteria bacterium]